MNPPCLHLKVREGSCIPPKLIEIPLDDQDVFRSNARVIIALEDDPAIQVKGRIWGGVRKYVTIRRKEPNAERFEVGAAVSVRLEEGNNDSTKC